MKVRDANIGPNPYNKQNGWDNMKKYNKVIARDAQIEQEQARNTTVITGSAMNEQTSTQYVNPLRTDGLDRPAEVRFTISEMRELCPTWFSKSSARFFGTTIAQPSDRFNSFITSDFTGFERNAKGYTLRQLIHEDGQYKIITIGDIAAFSNINDARAYLRAFRFGLHE